MEVTVLKEHLEKAVTELARIAPAKSSLPILANVLLATEKGWLTVTASDLEVTVKAYVGAQIEAEGAAVVPAATLSKMLRAIKADEAMTLTLDGKRLRLAMDGRTLALDGLDPEDFPPIPAATAETKATGKVYGEDLKDRLARTIICAATHDARPVLHTVNMAADGKMLTLAASDGYQLARFTLPYEGEPFELNLPLGAAAVLGRLLPDGEVEVSVSDKAVRFEGGYWEVTVAPVQGQFPLIERLIPDGYDCKATVDRDSLLEEVKTASVMARDGSGLIRLYATDGGLRVTARSEEVGNYEATLPTVLEDSGRMALNCGLLAGVLAAMDKGVVTLDWKDGHNPMRLMQTDDGLYLIMPMVVKWETSER